MSSFVNTINNTLLIQATTIAGTVVGAEHQVKFMLVSPPTAIPIFIDVILNGNLVQSVQIDTTGLFTIVLAVLDTIGLNNLYSFQVRAQGTINIDLKIQYIFFNPSVGISFIEYLTSSFVCIPTTSLQRNAPDLKISDFFSGLLKEFNLTCTGTDTPNTFLVETLNYWYASGNVFDITTFTDSTSIDIERVKLYKKISFRYQPSESITNKYYLQTGLKEYGNTEQPYPYDGGELNIDVPFENLMFSKYTGTNVQVGFSINSALAPYIPKPCILYYSQDVVATNPIYIKDSTSTSVCNSVQIFGQDTNVGGVDYSLNFAPETSTYLGIPIQQSLFATYYFDYLANLFDPKNRLTNVKAVLPISILTSLKLNDRLIIRDKRYIINDFIPLTPESNYRETEAGDLRNVEGFFLTDFRIIEN
jgi:hypothetical protein